MRPALQRGTALALALAFYASCASAETVRTLTLPSALTFPEGIGYDGAGHIFNASAVDGIVVRTSLSDGRSTTLVKPGTLLPPSSETFPRMLGMKVDSAGRLWIAGGRTGKIFVVDKETGQLVKELAAPGEGSLLNDAVVARDAVYVTDTLRPILWRIPLNGTDIGEPEPWVSFAGTPLVYGEGRNLNGIAATADGKSLIVVQMDKGLLFRIDVASKTVMPIPHGEEDLTTGDGLVLDGATLYLVRQGAGEVVSLELEAGLASAKVTSRFKDPALLWPATAVKVGDELLVVNSQFNKRQTKDAQLPFSVVAIPLKMLAPR